MTVLSRVQPRWLRWLVFLVLTFVASALTFALLSGIALAVAIYLPPFSNWELRQRLLLFQNVFLPVCLVVYYVGFTFLVWKMWWPQLVATYWNRKGNQLLHKGRDEEALTTYERALSRGPKLPGVWRNKGLALLRLKRYEDALVAFERALTLNPYYEPAWYLKGLTLIELERHEEALTALGKVLEINPRYTNAWNNIGNAYWRLQRYDEALTAFDNELSIHPDGIYKKAILCPTNGFSPVTVLS